MSDSSLNISLAGQSLTPPPNWLDIGVLATFENELQASITVQEFEFVLDSYTELKQHIANGLLSGTGIFDPVPFQIDVFSSIGNYLAFEGGINLAEAKINDTEGRILAPLAKEMGLNTLDDRLSGITYGLLAHNGLITSADYFDIQYIVERPDMAAEAAILAVTTFLMAKQLADAIADVGEQASVVAGLFVSGVTGPAGSVVYAAAVLIINIAYAASVLIILIQLAQDLVAAFLPSIRTHKGIRLKTLLEKACQHLGYTFNTTISDLDNIIYMPSNPNLDQEDGIKGFVGSAGSITAGIPHTSDYGYKASEAFRLCKDLFYAKYMLVGGVVELHAENAPYWQRFSTWNFPDILESKYRYNTDELNDSVLLTFSTDVSDGWTVGNYQGTSYQVITEAVTVGPSGRDHITGLDETLFPVALGTRKDALTGFEKALKAIAGVIDTVTGVFGGGTDFVSQIKSKVGILKVTTNNHTTPKLLWYEGNKIPADHRAKFSAKTLWTKYHSEKSFVANNYKRQRKVFEGVSIPFGFADFLQLIDNSYFTTPQGINGKIIKLEWNMSKDRAIVEYWTEEIYTKNLKETFIEPS